MFGRRTRNVLIAAAGLVVPLLLCYVVMIFVFQAHEEPAPSIKTPNPEKAPIAFLNPVELMVNVDPRMAGIFGALVYPWLAAYGAFLLVAGAIPPQRIGDRPWRFIAVAAMVGTLLAGPWWIAVVRLAMK